MKSCLHRLHPDHPSAMPSNSSVAQDDRGSGSYVRGTKLETIESSDAVLDEGHDDESNVTAGPTPAQNVVRENRRTPSLDGAVLKFQNITFVAGKGKKRKTIIENVSAEVSDGREFSIWHFVC